VDKAIELGASQQWMDLRVEFVVICMNSWSILHKVAV
jgi:hypothetical protein